MALDVSPLRRSRTQERRTALLAGVVTAAATLLWISRPASPDESGFLMVAGQWHAGGHSLYGDYWVDRPPLLIGLFRLASIAGGLVPLRLLGSLAAGCAVWALADTTRRLFPSSRRAIIATGLVGGALLLTPFFGNGEVDGEVLAAPFIALGLRLAVEALLSEDFLGARAAALGTGAAAMCAVLVKQNMADVVVVAAVAWIVGWRTHRLSRRTFLDLSALAAVGSLVAYAAISLAAMAHGTSPLRVYQATYPFRIRAAHVIAVSTSGAAGVRLSHLVLSFVLSGAPLVLGAGWFALRRLPPPLAWALAVEGAFVTFSVVSGGSYWGHYLIQGIPLLALLAGATAASPAPRLLRWGTPAVVAVSSVIVTVVTLVASPAASGATVGESLAPSVRPGDTVISAFGDPGIVRETGSTSPYPYLWSLPSRTLDPHMGLLRGILAGPAAPTWVVVRGPGTKERLQAAGVIDLLDARYHQVATLCGRTVLLLDGVVRTTPTLRGHCREEVQ